MKSKTSTRATDKVKVRRFAPRKKTPKTHTHTHIGVDQLIKYDVPLKKSEKTLHIIRLLLPNFYHYEFPF